MAFTILSERATGVVTLRDLAIVNMDGDQVTTSLLPTNFGDCWLLDSYVRAFSIATMRTTPELAGVTAYLGAVDGTEADYFASERWSLVNATQIAVRLYPELPIFWRVDEQFRLLFGEVDTNAAPTADLQVVVKVLRIRSQVGPVPDESFRLTS